MTQVSRLPYVRQESREALRLAVVAALGVPDGAVIWSHDDRSRPVKPYALLDVTSPPQSPPMESRRRGWGADIVPSEVTGLTVCATTGNAPPADPGDGSLHLVGTFGVDDFAGHSNAIATYNGMDWTFADATARQHVYVTTGALLFRFNGTTWLDASNIRIEDNVRFAELVITLEVFASSREPPNDAETLVGLVLGALDRRAVHAGLLAAGLTYRDGDARVNLDAILSGEAESRSTVALSFGVVLGTYAVVDTVERVNVTIAPTGGATPHSEDVSVAAD